MNALLTSAPTVRARRPQQATAAPQPLATAPAAAPPTLREQVAMCLRQAGVAPLDVGIFAAGYFAFAALLALLCVAARDGHENAWQWGQKLMNLPLAATGLAALCAATAASAVAPLLARRSRRGPAAAALGLAALGCLAFVTTVLMDYDVKWRYGIRPGPQFKPNARYAASRFGVTLPKARGGQPAADFPRPAPVARSVDDALGRRLFLGTCATCHAANAQGLPGQGKSLVANDFIRRLSDAQLLEFLRAGRPPWDPANTTKVQMPPRGGNPMLNDDDLRDIVAYLRSLQAGAPPVAANLHEPGQQKVAPGGHAASAPATRAGPDSDAALLAAGWVVMPPTAGPTGLSANYVADSTRPKWQAPPDGETFANAYYVATQFGLLHALGLTAVFAVLFVLALRGRVSAERRAAIALASTACSVVTLTWLLLMPFVYLL